MSFPLHTLFVLLYSTHEKYALPYDFAFSTIHYLQLSILLCEPFCFYYSCECNPGYYRDNVASKSTACLPCPTGSYCTSGGVRNGCVAGWTTPPGTLATSPMDCNVCDGCSKDGGVWCDQRKRNTLNGACSQCPSGSYCPASQSNLYVDILCDAGYSCSGLGNKKQNPCPAGTYSDRIGRECQACGAGEYSQPPLEPPGQGITGCTPCDIGRCVGSRMGWLFSSRMRTDPLAK